MIGPNDWRLQGQEKYLTGRELILKKYTPLSKVWEHEHCEFCSEKISEYDGDLHEGYVTADTLRTWICPECYEDFKDMFSWKIVQQEE